MRYHTGVSSLVLSIALIHGTAASAQTTPKRGAQSAAPDPVSADPDAAPLPVTDPVVPDADDDAIVVTGSRLPSEFSLTAPVQVIRADTAANAGLATAAEMVARSTAALGTQQVNNQMAATGAGGMVVSGGANVSTISLRNLSAIRTLTLLNGQRIAPSGTGSQVAPVDYNVIPAIALDRVEVLTTGASSVYGSDAIAGVVNAITRKGGNGLEIGGFGRVSQAGGGEYLNANAYWGRNYENFYASLAVEYDRQYELNLKDRAETACAQDFVYSPTSGERVDARDRSGNFRCYNHNPTGIFFDPYWYGGSFTLDPGRANGPYPAAALNLQSLANPATAPLRDWVRTNRAGFPDTFAYSPNTSRAFEEADSISPYSRLNAFFSAGFDVAGHSEFYLTGLYSHRESTSNSWYFLYPLLAATNPNNTVGSALIAASGGNSPGVVGPQVVRPFRAEQRVDFAQASFGLRGTFTGGALKGWRYDANARVGLSRGTYGQTFYYQDRLNAATAPGTACDARRITISGPTPCVSIPWLTKRFLVDQNWSDAERSFLEGYEEGHTRYDQFALEASLSGTLFTLPAGDVALAVGGTIRTDDLDDTPGYNARNQNYFAFSTAGRTAGSDTVREVYGELGVPLLAGLPLIRSLQVTASGRYTDYSSYGSNGTYRVAGAWEVVKPIALRASYGTSFRAPTIYELNLADQTSFFGYTDPCQRYGEGANATVAANCRADGFAADFTPANITSIRGISGGGAGNLKAETSTNLNFGVVVRPGFAGLQLAVDYYDIRVRNQVTTFGVSNIIGSCYRLSGPERQSFCSQITRDPVTRAITEVSNRYLNLSEQRARGIDVALQLAVPLPGEVRLGFELRGTRALETSVTRDALSTKLERNGLSGFPELSGYAEANLSWRKLSWFVGANYIGKVDDTRYWTDEEAFVPGTDHFRFYGAYAGRNTYGNSNDFAEVVEKLSVPAYVTAYTSLRAQVLERTTLQVGVTNLFDRRPAVIGPDAFTYRIGSVAGNQYNLTGRSFFVRLKQGF
ncbi:TonB-dependent receptor plug domain-containing protein [Sphingomonas sp. Leaf25]|uniref:TonB-dependent receptor plug domain-containing protein n=1 Tax=Sphingomonas sp. Leaf25 TaxID=1735692 RepID=UPI0006F80267|nr:TonB-dependent receptor [Sphingomonas sp. Leaf25]KQN03861.1 hypothetical protein ASE78_01980 [Sphingomonas sp. Leaf25]